MTSKWSIPSSSGRDTFECNLLGPIDSPPSHDAILASIRISGLFWNRANTIPGANLAQDYEITLPQTVLSLAATRTLVQQLSNWLESPTEVSTDLAIGQDPTLRVFIGQTKDLIWNEEKPSLVIEYTGAAIKSIRVAYVVDRTCIQIAHDELKSSLEGLSESGDYAIHDTQIL